MQYTEVDLVLMLVLGFFSSFHCLTMCGPLIAVASAPAVDRNKTAARQLSGLARWQLLYQLGRGVSYGVIGAGLALAGTSLAQVSGARIMGGLIQLAIGLTLIGLALYLLLRGKASALPGPGTWLTRALRKMLTRGTSWSVVVLGLLTGLLPCGVLYAAYARCVAAPGPLEGAGFMLAFWLGSTPLLIGVGVLSGGLIRWVGRYANAFLIGAILLTGGWVTFKGVKNVLSDTPMKTHHTEMSQRPSSLAPSAALCRHLETLRHHADQS